MGTDDGPVDAAVDAAGGVAGDEGATDADGLVPPPVQPARAMSAASEIVTAAMWMRMASLSIP